MWSRPWPSLSLLIRFFSFFIFIFFLRYSKVHFSAVRPDMIMSLELFSSSCGLLGGWLRSFFIKDRNEFVITSLPINNIRNLKVSSCLNISSKLQLVVLNKIYQQSIDIIPPVCQSEMPSCFPTSLRVKVSLWSWPVSPTQEIHPWQYCVHPSHTGFTLGWHQTCTSWRCYLHSSDSQCNCWFQSCHHTCFQSF